LNLRKSLTKKDGGYTCKDEPFKSYCDPVLCAVRKFGIGKDAPDAPGVGGLTILLSEPRVYCMDVDGSRIQLTTEQLQNQVLWQRACMEQMNIMPAKMKDGDWRDLIDTLLNDATRISVPDELTHKSLFMELVEVFCTSRIAAHSPEELLTGKPWTEEGRTYFKLSALQEVLKRNGFTH